MHKKLKEITFCFSIIIVLLFSNCKSNSAEPVISKITAKQYKNITSNLSNKTIVHYWFSYCEPCVKKIPELEKIAQEKNLNIIHISADKSDSKMQENLARVMKKLNMRECYIVDFNDLYPNGTKITAIQKDFAEKVGWKEYDSPYYILLDKTGKSIVSSGDLEKIKEKL